MKNTIFLFLLCILLVSCNKADTSNEASTESTPESPDYLNTALSFEARVDDLVGRMTLGEKISQMYNEAPAIERLGVPEYNWWNEALHGVARAGKATVFPQAIGMAAMFDEKLMGEIATVISDEGRAKYHYFVDNEVVFRYTGLTFWSPNINIFRDPRWGRGQETYGEDPYLTGQLALQFINGLQGDDKKYLKTAATAKHFAVHSGPEKSRHSDNYISTQKDLYETYLPAFETAVVEGNVESVMCAYNRVNDDPACGSDMLLKEILRGKYGFDGHVVSDCGAIADFYVLDAHNVVRSPAAAAAWAVKSGTDLNCGTGRLSTFSNLHFALQRKMITEEEIDVAVKRLFMTRFKLGMFDPDEDVPFASIPMSVVGSEKHLALTRKASEQSMVLLKNDGLLPLKAGTKVAVIGPNATNSDILVGNYNGEPIQPVTPLAGIQAYAGKENVSYAAGTALIADVYGHYEIVSADNFFHQDENNQRVPGLQGSYYNAKLDEVAQRNGRMSGDIIGEPVLTRVDNNIDFYWEKSPLDNSVRDEFGVVWKGQLVPSETGKYKFQRSAIKVLIDGLEVKEPIDLVAGQPYEFEASRTFLRTWWGNPIEPFANLRWVNLSKNLVAEAVAAAEKADVVVFMGGISPRLEGEEMRVELDGFDFGDRTHIKLPQVQRDLLEVLHALGKPIVMVNFSGSAMALNWEDRNLNAIVQAFYPGEATGAALADLLWGEFSPSGRLPVTFYHKVSDLPAFTDYTMENRTYKYYEGDVLYPFGYGLSYSRFTYDNLQVEKSDDGSLELSVDLTNAGEMESAEVSQVYISMPDAPVRVPQRELVFFKHTQLQPGETRKITFSLDAKQLTFVDNEGKRQAYPGDLLLSVGSGQSEFLDDKTAFQLVTVSLK